jgi:hypothetical protein
MTRLDMLHLRLTDLQSELCRGDTYHSTLAQEVRQTLALIESGRGELALMLDVLQDLNLSPGLVRKYYDQQYAHWLESPKENQ